MGKFPLKEMAVVEELRGTEVGELHSLGELELEWEIANKTSERKKMQ